jgi:uncharacterized SAM-binding protein YcdF (DUF218 family)
MLPNRLLQLIGGATLAAVLLIAFTPVAGVIGARTAFDPVVATADAIVVLGAGLFPEGELDESSLRRTIRGIEIFKRGLAPRLVLLGSERVAGYGSEAEVRARLAQTMGVPPEAIILEDQAQNTRGEAILTRDRLSGTAVRSIILVTETEHLRRAIPLFENAGFEVFGAPASDYSIQPDGPSGRLHLMKRIVEEQLARFYYRLAGYL